MTPDEVKNHPLFKKLTVKQQTFVSEMLANGGDQIKAALAAYDCNGKDSARAMANRQMDHPNIAWLIEAYFESDPASVAFTRETALSFAAKKARTANDPKTALDYFKIAMGMSGFLVKPADPVPAPPSTPTDDSNTPFEEN